MSTGSHPPRPLPPYFISGYGSLPRPASQTSPSTGCLRDSESLLWQTALAHTISQVQGRYSSRQRVDERPYCRQVGHPTPPSGHIAKVKKCHNVRSASGTFMADSVRVLDYDLVGHSIVYSCHCPFSDTWERCCLLGLIRLSQPHATSCVSCPHL